MSEKGDLVDCECRMLRKDGSVIWTSRNASAVHDKVGNVAHYQGIVRRSLNVSGLRRLDMRAMNGIAQ